MIPKGLYERQRAGKYIFLVTSGIAIVIFLIIASNIVRDLGRQERERMHIWAQATQRLATAEGNTDFEFLLGIITQNNTIPVLIADSAFNIIDCRNFDLPDKASESGFVELTPRNLRFLQKRLTSRVATVPSRKWHAQTRISSNLKPETVLTNIYIMRTPFYCGV